MAANSKNEYGGKAHCPKVSASRFGELVSLYLDKEASKEELELLSLLVRHDAKAKEDFFKACQIHLATCSMFGKTCVLSKLPGFHVARRKRISRRRATFEWAAAAALMVMSAMLFEASRVIERVDPAYSTPADLDIIADTEVRFDVTLADSFVVKDGACSVFNVTDRK